jgi:hypothetical protein
MKALLLIEDDDKAREVERHVKPLGFETIRYRNPVKALDNLDEIEPDAIIASALDFPRHWKIITDVVRSTKSKNECVIILLRGQKFGGDEVAKAKLLDVNGIVSEKLDENAERDGFSAFFRPRDSAKDSASSAMLEVGPGDRLCLLLSHPKTTRIFGGSIQAISRLGLSFLPERGEELAHLANGTLFTDCSLRVGDKILSPQARIARSGLPLKLSFEGLPVEETKYLDQWIKSNMREKDRSAKERLQKSEI